MPLFATPLPFSPPTQPRAEQTGSSLLRSTATLLGGRSWVPKAAAATLPHTHTHTPALPQSDLAEPPTKKQALSSALESGLASVTSPEPKTRGGHGPVGRGGAYSCGLAGLDTPSTERPSLSEHPAARPTRWGGRQVLHLRLCLASEHPHFCVPVTTLGPAPSNPNEASPWQKKA